MSQEAFAEILNVTRQTVSNWENSKNYPDIETLILISDKFNISLDILLKGDKEMIKSIDKNVRASFKYKKILIIISSIVMLFILTFGGYAIKYNITKNKLEANFKNALTENDFKKNRDGYYSLKFNDKITYGVPNQKMPSLLDFSLHFHNTVLYCDVSYQDGRHLKAIWSDYNYFSFWIEKDDVIIESSSDLKDKNDITKISKELKVDENELKLIIKKGNQLYREFYE